MSELLHIQHPELFDLIPITGDRTADIVNSRAAEVERLGSDIETGTSVVIRALNEGLKLEGLLQDVSSQKFAGEVQIVVVDNESTDATPDIARSYGAEVVTIPRNDFTHPKSMNLGMEAAAYDTVFMTVGHARLSNDQTLRAASAQLVKPRVAAAYGVTLPNANASITERLVSVGTPFAIGELSVKKAGMGVLGATNAVISREVWQELGKFDERYQRGGEDTLIAGDMIEAGLEVVRDPALAVHHTHGLTVGKWARQAMQWQQTLSGPQEFDQRQWAARRPDLDFS